MTLSRPLLALSALALLSLALAGCGRRGPLELPPETQARGEALKAQEAARPRSGPRPAPGAEDGRGPPPAIPGTIGHRPPDQYPFLLDPLL